MDAAAIILEFADHLLAGLSALRANSMGVGRAAMGQPLTFETADGERTRLLDLPGGGVAALHGRGCSIRFSSGAEVDFDWDPEHREVFDAWRVLQFANSIGQSDVSQDDVVNAMRSDSRYVETEAGWFALSVLFGTD